MEIVLATTNPNKLREFRAMLQDIDIEVVSLDSFSNCPEIIEDGESFAENALKKARTIAQHTGCMTLADDSGLEVDFLGGMPGIYSARYAGEKADDRKNNEKLLKKLKDVPTGKRGARFKCVIAAVAPDGAKQVVEGAYPGIIIPEPRGSNGFGYDPIFLDEQTGLTYAEMDPEYKNRISHRSQAIRELKKILPRFLERCGKSNGGVQ